MMGRYSLLFVVGLSVQLEKRKDPMRVCQGEILVVARYSDVKCSILRDVSIDNISEISRGFF
jgi:hypothetical protein